MKIFRWFSRAILRIQAPNNMGRRSYDAQKLKESTYLESQGMAHLSSGVLDAKTAHTSPSAHTGTTCIIDRRSKGRVDA